ncbi:uncharacterized protein STEHIDRAFT_52329, partial [Stereum hirsutum FP-91666 SS1]|uniref:uncharacterized protein n=1 Tax=Stereum hirsutum (strain FP-91666) TaxID=721885 RepID=UPI0004410202
TGGNNNDGQGASNNTFSYSDDAGNTYSRQVGASANSITYDTQSGSLPAAGGMT